MREAPPGPSRWTPPKRGEATPGPSRWVPAKVRVVPPGPSLRTPSKEGEARPGPPRQDKGRPGRPRLNNCLACNMRRHFFRECPRLDAGTKALLTKAFLER